MTIFINFYYFNIMQRFLFDLNYSSKEKYFIIFSILLIIIFLTFLIIRTPKWFDILISIIIFSILIKVFLLSSDKDAFHYSWYLGPSNSLSSTNNLLDNIASQYGYLNILLINKISELSNFESSYVIVSVIIIFS